MPFIRRPRRHYFRSVDGCTGRTGARLATGLRLRTWNYDEPPRDGRAAPERAGLCQARAPDRLGGRDRRADRSAAVHWCDGSAGRIRPPVRATRATPARCAASTPSCARTATSPAATRATWPGSRTAPSSAANAKRTPARPTLDGAAPRCAQLLQTGRGRACSAARCAAARCTWCRSRWGRSARRSRTSASSCPTRRMSRSTCAS